MRILAIDYGRRHIGLAVSENRWVQPLATLNVKKFSEAVEKVASFCQSKDVDLLVLGITPGALENEVRGFGERLSKVTGVKLEFWDETLSSADARQLLITLGKKRSERQKLEHAYSAALILESYLKGEKRSLSEN